MFNSTNDIIGSIGKFSSIIQSSTIKIGLYTEELIYNQLIDNGYTDLTPPLNNDNKSINISDMLKQIDTNKKYIGKKIRFNGENKNIELDLLIYENHTFYLYELKSSSRFDTKKSYSEVTQLFKALITLKKNTENFEKFNNVKFETQICSLYEENVKNIYTGFKGNILDSATFFNDKKNLSKINLYLKKNSLKLGNEKRNLSVLTNNLLQKIDFNDNKIKCDLNFLMKFMISATTGNDFFNRHNINNELFFSLIKKQFIDFINEKLETEELSVSEKQCFKICLENFLITDYIQSVSNDCFNTIN